MVSFLKNFHKHFPDAFFVMLSLSGVWFWLHIFIFNFDTSPLNDLLYKTGADSGLAQMAAFICMAAGACAQVFFFNEKTRNKTTPWFALGWIAATAALGVLTSPVVYYGVLAVMGLCAGLLLARLMLLLVFLLPRQDSARYIIVQFTLTNIPFMVLRASLLGHNTLLNYSVIVVIQILSALALLHAKPDILRLRAQIPDKKISVREILTLFAITAGIYFCMGGIQAVARPNFAQTPYIYLFQIIPNVITIVVYFLWIYRVRLIINMTFFFVLLGLAFATFQISGGSVGGRYVFEFFVESANYFIDVFEFVVFARLIYAFGRRAFRVKILIALLILIIGGAYAVAALFWDTSFSAGQYTLFYVVILLLLAGVPYFAGALPFLFGENEVPVQAAGPPDALPYDALAADGMAAQLLTQNERSVLYYLSQKQDYDVIASLLSVSQKELREQITSIFSKLGVNSRGELFDQVDRFEKLGLTAREKELAALLLTGEAQKNIAAKMGVSYSTVKFHSNNLYRKLNIQSRAELFQLFVPGVAPAGGLPKDTPEETEPV